MTDKMQSVLACVKAIVPKITYYRTGTCDTSHTSDEYVYITITNKNSAYKFRLLCDIQGQSNRVYALIPSSSYCMFVLLGDVQYCLILVSPQDEKNTSIHHTVNSQLVFDIVPFYERVSLLNLLTAAYGNTLQMKQKT
jgi:hypothetical protein